MAKSEIGRAVDKALSMLGESPKQALIHYLQHDYNIDIYSDNVSLEEIGSALQHLMGQAAPILMSLIDEELRKS